MVDGSEPLDAIHALSTLGGTPLQAITIDCASISVE